MGAREYLSTDAARLPLTPPGRRSLTTSNTGAPDDEETRRFFSNLTAEVHALEETLVLENRADYYDSLAHIETLRRELDAAEALLLADGLENVTRYEAMNADPTSWHNPSGEEELTEEDIRRGVSAGYFNVQRTSAEMIRSTYLNEVALLTGSSEALMNQRLVIAEGLRHLFPATLETLRKGRITYKSASTIVLKAQDLTEEQARVFEAKMLPFAVVKPDASVMAKARREHAKLDTSDKDRTPRARAKHRAVKVWAEEDGQAVLQMRGPAEDIAAIEATLDYHVQQLLATVEGSDERTVGAVRFDVLRDALLDGWPAGGGSTLKPKVIITIPAVQLLLHPEKDVAQLQGYGPIPTQAALHLASQAPSLLPMLTDPWSGAVIDVGRVKYRPPKALRDLLQARDEVCQFPGCRRTAVNCEVDHRVDWAAGGGTSRENAHLLCKRHQLFKHALGWEYVRRADGVTVWTSPNGVRAVSIAESVQNVQGLDVDIDGDDKDLPGGGPDEVTGGLVVPEQQPRWVAFEAQDAMWRELGFGPDGPPPGYGHRNAQGQYLIKLFPENWDPRLHVDVSADPCEPGDYDPDAA